LRSPGVPRPLPTTRGRCLPTPAASRPRTACPGRAPRCQWRPSTSPCPPWCPPPPPPSSPNSRSSRKHDLHRTPLVSDRILCRDDHFVSKCHIIIIIVSLDSWVAFIPGTHFDNFLNLCALQYRRFKIQHVYLSPHTGYAVK